MGFEDSHVWGRNSEKEKYEILKVNNKKKTIKIIQPLDNKIIALKGN